MVDCMAKEVPKVSNGHQDPLKRIFNRELFGHAKGVSKPTEKPLQGLFRRIGEFLQGEEKAKEEHPLIGRISELHSSAEEGLVALISFKQRMEREADPQLYSFICTLVDPIIKEVSRIQQSIEREGNTAQKVKSFTRYVDWIEKAHEWVRLGKDCTGGEEVKQAVISQTVKDFTAKIDGDIRVVQDYLNHAMSELNLSDALKSELKEKLMPELSPSLRELYSLRLPEKELSLEEFIEWRLQADHNREHLFGRALHVIDTFSEEFLPSPSRESETGHALAGMTQLNYVESNLSEVALELEGDQPMDGETRRRYLERLNRLDDEIHHLNGNLHLSHEQHDRLQQSIESLSALRERLSM